MKTLEIVPAAFPRSLQTRASFPVVEASRDSVLGKVQVADELGFAYLDGDIDFGATGKNEIFQNLKTIVMTAYFSCPLDREFGMDYSMIDRPIKVAEAIFTQEVAMKLTLYEPRAQFREISFVEDHLAGKLSPTIVVVLLTDAELPSSIPGGVPATSAAVGGAPGTTIEEVDLPAFYESLIEMARVPGPIGPVGPVGKAATIEAGETTTGEPGTDAEVVNVGNEYDAIFDFIIPRGEKGDQGTGVSIKGTVPNEGALPPTGDPGDMWITADTGHGWTWDGEQWIDVGPIQGPPGNTGAQGPQGVKGDVGDTGETGPSNVLTVDSTVTGAPGSNANVTISGTTPAQALAFVIPTGAPGPQGSQGPQGPQGIGTQGVPGVQGPQGVNAYTTTTANFDLPAVGSTVVVTLANASWVTIGQMVVVQTAGGAPTDAYSLKVTAKTGNQVTLKNMGTDWSDDLPAHAWSHLDNGLDVIPVATTTRTGLAPKLSGLASTFLDGTGAYVVPSSAALMPVSSVIQTTIFEYTTWNSSNVIIPIDATIPQIGEGKQMFTVPFTPLFANSRIYLVFNGVFYGASIYCVCALFKDSVANALTVNTTGISASLYSNINLVHYDPAPGSLNQIIYQIRFGPHSTGTIYVNGATGANFGGVQKCVLTIQEIKQ